MDYQCPSCRRYTPDVARLMAEDSRVRWIIRDTPILSKASEEAARLAIASTYQGRHAAFHDALMATKGQLTPDRIRAAADRARIDWPRLQADLAAHRTAIDAQIARNMDLASATGIRSTPAFIIGDTLANGAMDYRALKAEVAEYRRKNGTVAPDAEPPAEASTPPPSPPAEATPQAAAAPPLLASSAAPTPERSPTPAQAEPSSRLPVIAALVIAALAALGGALALRRRRG